MNILPHATVLYIERKLMEYGINFVLYYIFLHGKKEKKKLIYN